MIANFRDQGVKAYRAAKLLHRSLETVYRVYRFLAAGHTLQEYYQHYRENKAHCGRKAIQLPTDEVTYIKAKVAQGWTPDTVLCLRLPSDSTSQWTPLSSAHGSDYYGP
ncbi:hypothetical protein HHK02_11180 [Limosilactobacillus reuteri]|uniref:IS30 family transposase n=1 Tax=Limosilactobacillus reuteri TaxID=1598 RepID=A0A7L6BHM1_LIMRT|nr:hypothetical protein HHK02_11180 [Limosilactobacillus reuteri]